MSGLTQAGLLADALRQANERIAEMEAELERARTLLTEDLSVLRMGPSDKGFTLETAGRMVAVIAGELATWLREHEAKNYTETAFEQIEVSGGSNRYIITVQRASGKTPHQLRMEAEADRTALLEVLCAARDLLADLDDRAADKRPNPGQEMRMSDLRETLAALPERLTNELKE